MNINMDDVKMLVELRGVYDGWSVAIMKDGSIVNRWDKKSEPRRWRKTQDYINENGSFWSEEYKESSGE